MTHLGLGSSLEDPWGSQLGMVGVGLPSLGLASSAWEAVLFPWEAWGALCLVECLKPCLPDLACLPAWEFPLLPPGREGWLTGKNCYLPQEEGEQSPFPLEFSLLTPFTLPSMHLSMLSKHFRPHIVLAFQYHFRHEEDYSSSWKLVYNSTRCSVPEITSLLQDLINRMRNLHQITSDSAVAWWPRSSGDWKNYCLMLGVILLEYHVPRWH